MTTSDTISRCAGPGGGGLAGRTALVTGGAKRLGRALCEALAAEGVRIVVHYLRSRQEAESLAGALGERAGVQAWTLQADLGDPEAAESTFARAVELAGPIDFLVNNASTFPLDRLTEASIEDFRRAVQVNALAPLALSRAFFAQRREGAILHLLDARIADYDREHASYHASKRMLFTLMRMMAAEFAPLVRVNAVAPGLILPPPGKDESYLENLKHTNPLGAHGSPSDVTDAALYLLRARFVTGQVLFVDGGRHMKGNFYGC